VWLGKNSLSRGKGEEPVSKVLAAADQSNKSTYRPRIATLLLTPSANNPKVGLSNLTFFGKFNINPTVPAWMPQGT
jgi:hypothetical protein